MRAALVFAALFLGSCGSESPTRTHGQPSPAMLFGPEITTVIVEVDYARGSEPYTGNLAALGDVWHVFQVNVERLFEHSPKKVLVPSNLGEMEALNITGRSFTTEDILQIASHNRNAINTPNTATFYALWLPGHY